MDGEDMEEYCSSEEDMDEEEGDAAMDVDGQDMDASSMKRILAWRADFYAQIGATLSGKSPAQSFMQVTFLIFPLSESSLLKRKFDDDDQVSSSPSSASKRSRRSTSPSALTAPLRTEPDASPASSPS